MLRRAMLLDPWDDLARYAYLDECELAHGARPACFTEWKGTLEDFMRDVGGLFATDPVREVTLTDKGPLRSRDGITWVGVGEQWFLPESLPLWLCAGWVEMHEAGAPDSKLFRFPSRQAANHALSLNAVNYGRSLVGLPPLPPRP
jgi:hypothetical protein